jgi:hypothetical protein
MAGQAEPERRRVAFAPLFLASILCAGHAGDVLALAPARSDTMRLQLLPAAVELAAGDTLRVDLVVPEAGPEFNAYDAFVSYDSEVFTFLQQDNLMDQEGPLMREACGQTFHLFSIAPDSTHVVIHHSLLCNNLFLTGPGVVYRLLFLCKDVDADSWLRLLREPPTVTRVIRAGILVQPLVTTDARVRVGAGSGTTVPPAPATGLQLRAAPNPCNPQTVLIYTLSENATVVLRIYTPDGRLVRRLANGAAARGESTAVWDGRDDAGRNVAAGVYLARLQTDHGVVATRVCLVR